MQHFLNIADFSADELWQFLYTAKELKEELGKGGNKPILQGKILGMLFQKPSLRTRVSFEVGMLQLGGEAIYISPNEVGLGTRESVPDVARVLSGYVDGIETIHVGNRYGKQTRDHFGNCSNAARS